MKSKRFIGWFTDIGFTCRVLIICEMLMEWAVTWGAAADSPFVQAVREVEETAQLEMEKYEEIGRTAGYFEENRAAPYMNTVEDLNPRPPG